MAIFDWLLLAVLACSMVLGIWRGLVFEVLSVLGWVVAFVAAQWWAPALGEHLPISGAADSVRYVAAFVLVFVLTAFACGLVASLVKRLIQAAGLRPVDRVLGMAFGLLRGVILILVAGVIICSTPLHRQIWWQESEGAGIVTSALQTLRQAMPAEYAKYLP